MTIDEFSKLTGFYPTVSMYETIEKGQEKILRSL